MSEIRSDHSRNLVRLLRLLDRQSGKKAERHDDGSMATIICSNRSYRFERNLLDEAVGTGLLNQVDREITVTGTGLQKLKRLLHPDEPFLAQQAELTDKQIEVDGTKQIVICNNDESPLHRLHTRPGKDGKPWLDHVQFEAGERFRSDFEKASLQPRISANWEASVACQTRAGGCADLSDFALDARKRFNWALEALGPELTGVATDICCFLKGLEEVEREHCWPPRSAKLMLRTALSVLGRHYGLQTKPANSAKNNKTRHWGTGDYRPIIGVPVTSDGWENTQPAE